MTAGRTTTPLKKNLNKAEGVPSPPFNVAADGVVDLMKVKAQTELPNFEKGCGEGRVGGM